MDIPHITRKVLYRNNLQEIFYSGEHLLCFTVLRVMMDVKKQRETSLTMTCFILHSDRQTDRLDCNVRRTDLFTVWERRPRTSLATVLLIPIRPTR